MARGHIDNRNVRDHQVRHSRRLFFYLRRERLMRASSLATFLFGSAWVADNFHFVEA
jgi:hypothetical protein